MSGGGANDNDPAPEEPVPYLREGRARQDVKPPLPKRFYSTVAVIETKGAHSVLLDGRPVKTPANRALAVPARALADAVAAEWAAQGGRIDPATMPLTRLANTTLDAVAEHAADVAADIVAYAGRDALCYRADAPAGLVAQQAALWDPPLAWAAARFGVPFAVTTGVVPVSQPDALAAAFAVALGGHGPFALAPLHVMTTLTGSAVLALAILHGHLSPEAAWTAAHVDEDWQISTWGPDEEAQARREARWREMAAAALFLKLATRG